MPASRRPPVDDALAALCAGERGFVLGAAWMGSARVTADGLIADEAQRCRQAGAALDALPAAERAATLARWSGRLTDPIPAGLAEVHTDWLRQVMLPHSIWLLRAAVDGLPAAVVAIAAAIARERGDDEGQLSPPLADESLAAVRRVLFADIVSVDAEPADGPRLSSLVAQGAETLGVSLRGAPRPVIARAAAQIGQPAAQRLLDAAARAGSPTERQAARDRVGQVRPQDTRLGAAAAIGVYQLAESLIDETEDGVLAIAQRLPLPVGDLLLDAVGRSRARR
ncbi:MAG TPA: hypothetical protein VH374_09185 [Polyangia bacterium]|jgi:hypothetical protein|nr:hypothetical protein [Polyangia bacterium]